MTNTKTQQHKFHVGQQVYLTGGPNGTRKIPGEVVVMHGDGGFIVRVDGPHSLWNCKGPEKYLAGRTWSVSPGGLVYSTECRIIPAEPQEADFTAQWDQVQAFAAERGVTVPDLPEPEDADLAALREAFAAEYDRRGLYGSAQAFQEAEYDEAPPMRAALAYVKKVRAEFEGEG